MEFLMGRALGNALASLGLHGEFEAAARAAGKEPGDILEVEPDAALGNGGLGRLANCARIPRRIWCAILKCCVNSWALRVGCCLAVPGDQPLRLLTHRNIRPAC
jgi:hypothetical protein